MCNISDFKNSKGFSAKKNLFSPSKVSDFPKRLSISLTPCSTTNVREASKVYQLNCGKNQETYSSNFTPNTGEINETNKSYSSNTISSERQNKTPQKVNIKNQDNYELRTSFEEANKTPVKLRDTFLDGLDSAQKNKIKTANIVKSSTGSIVNKLPSSNKMKVSTPTKNTPSKLDRELKHLNIDMVDQNTKSPVRQKKRKSKVASSNLQRDINEVAEDKEISKHDRDSDSCTSFTSAETTILTSKVKEQISLSKKVSNVLSTTHTKIEINHSSCSSKLKKTPNKKEIENEDSYESEVSFEEPNNKTRREINDSFSSSDENNSNEIFTFNDGLAFSKRNSDAINSSSKNKNKTVHISNLDSDSIVNESPLSNKTKFTTPEKHTPSRVNRNLKCLNIDMHDQNPTSPKRQIKRKAGVKSLNLQRANDKIDELSNEDSDSDSCSSISSEETTKFPPKNRRNPNFIEEKLCNNKFSLSRIESKRLQIDMNDSSNKSFEDKSPIYQRTTRLKSTNKSSPNRLGSNADKRMKSENVFENDKEAKTCKSPMKIHLTPNKKENLISYGNSFSPTFLKSSKIPNHAQVSSPLQKQRASVTTPISKKVCCILLLLVQLYKTS